MTEPEAIDRFERDPIVERGAAHLDSELLLGARGKGVAAGSLAGLGAAKFQHAAPERLLLEVMIEGDRAVDLGARQIQRLGDERHYRLRHAAEGLLQCLKDGEGGPLQMTVPRDDFDRAVGVPWFVSWHAQPL